MRKHNDSASGLIELLPEVDGKSCCETSEVSAECVFCVHVHVCVCVCLCVCMFE